MTDITLEKRARGLPPELAAKWKHMTERHITREYRTATFTEHECRLIEAALRLSAGADWVLVPVRLSAEHVSAVKDMVADEYGMHSIYARPLWANLLQIVAGLTIDYQEAVNEQRALAAAPRHELGEVQP